MLSPGQPTSDFQLSLAKFLTLRRDFNLLYCYRVPTRFTFGLLTHQTATGLPCQRPYHLPHSLPHFHPLPCGIPSAPIVIHGIF